MPIESGVDDPDQMFYENYYSGAARNYAGYSDPETDKLIDQQSMDGGPEEAQRNRLADRAQAGGSLFPAGHLFTRRRRLLRSPGSRAITPMTNSIYNGWRMEDVWLDKKS